jgi:hypothetical protein
MVDPVPQEAHDHAAVVFSRSFRFVEWRFVIATPATSTPFGDRNATPYQAAREIDRRKWIYVFRNNHERETYADVQEEIRVDKNGDMAAVPADRIGRADPAPLGKTMCLPRRRFGNPLVYRFLASRVRLAPAQIKELKSKVTTFAPPVILDPGDNLSVIEYDGELLVPVVDPVTVALNLHAAFTAAADDIVNYTAAHSENTNRRIVERRRKKQLLATLLKSIIGEADNTGANNLVHELKDQQWPLEDFVSQYEAQVQWRVERRDRLGSFLTRWLESDALRIAAAAYKSASKDSWPQFLTPWCQAITRLGESPPGRRYLDALLDDRTHFIHTYVWPQKALPEDGIQAVRKGGMTIFEAWKTLAERKSWSRPAPSTAVARCRSCSCRPGSRCSSRSTRWSSTATCSGPPGPSKPSELSRPRRSSQPGLLALRPRRSAQSWNRSTSCSPSSRRWTPRNPPTRGRGNSPSSASSAPASTPPARSARS